ncbi:sugar ABC transporter substrate-binding protein [Embleya scabrispora]|uniref:Sugar ABC transporter substrate-binding protein n=1 Tax=Embleya scabrispora TaxID=159449 RepID=A0A1T3NPY2_9ACTN|nr:substrate-binding domain-containing protein [Embleya scabrispora]OPC78808.1 sugar ABC transporter substrate-binding protein [Embleya scabrispora]
MRKRFLVSVSACVLVAAGTLSACSDTSGSGSGSTGATGASGPAGGNGKKAKIGVILPDSKTSGRWETNDRKYLTEAFKAAGVDYDIQNAQGDKSQFQTLADQMITNGATVLIIVNLDSGTGKAVLDKAKSQGVATIDYDRLTLGGSAQYYVSFDNVKVGTLMGQGIEKCLSAAGAQKPTIAMLNGSATDNNATLLKQGYDGVLKPKFDSGEYVKGPDQAVPDWNNTEGANMFEQMLTQSPNISGVVAANDGLGNAAISILKKQKLNGRVPVTGQDAETTALQNILVGDQCMTVYKAIKKEADAVSGLAVALAKGQKPSVPATVRDPEGKRDVPSVLLEPLAIYKENVKDVVADGYVTKDTLCTGAYAAKCTEFGVN